MTDDGADVFRGLRARLRELEEDKALLEGRLARADVETQRLRSLFRVVLEVSRAGRVRQAAYDALYSLRWPKGVKPRAATPVRAPDEDTQP